MFWCSDRSPRHLGPIIATASPLSCASRGQAANPARRTAQHLGSAHDQLAAGQSDRAHPSLFPETGHNFDLQDTLRYAYRNNERVSLWGPYQIEKDLYDRAMDQIALLESGDVLYKANDMGRFSKRVSNCIHAVSSVAQGVRLWVAEPGFGQAASFAISKRFRPWIIDKDEVHAWVGSAIGLDEYPIIYRDWTPPRSGGLIIGPLFRLFGADRNVQPTYGPPR